jgi:hypothetical protein
MAVVCIDSSLNFSAERLCIRLLRGLILEVLQSAEPTSEKSPSRHLAFVRFPPADKPVYQGLA